MNKLFDRAIPSPSDTGCDKVCQPPLVELINVSKSFTEVGGTIHVLTNLNFTVPEKSFMAIMGASGVGKSTLLHILGLLDRPTNGRINFQGQNTTGLSDKKISVIRNRKIGFVFQFHHLMPDFNACENLLIPALISGEKQPKAHKRACELLDLVALSHRSKHLPSELSGGERQRLALARALVCEPRLLLTDEPSGNLDAKNTEVLHEQLKSIHRELGVSIIVVTHDQALADITHSQYLLTDGTLNLIKGHHG